MPGPCRPCPPVSSLPVFAVLSPFSLLWRRAHPFHQLVYVTKYVKKSRKNIFLTKSRQSCTFMKVGGRYAARPSEDSDVLRWRQKSKNIVPKICRALPEDSNVLLLRQKSENIVRKICRAPPQRTQPFSDGRKSLGIGAGRSLRIS